MKTDKKWFADTTNVLNVFKNDAVIQTADDGNGNMAVSGNNVDAQTETTTEEKLNIDLAIQDEKADSINIERSE